MLEDFNVFTGFDFRVIRNDMAAKCTNECFGKCFS